MVVALLVPMSANAAGKSLAAKAAKPGASTIVEIVLAPDGQFDVLEAAVVHAGLVDALNGTKQYTVFAPTDQAFINAMPGGDEAEVIGYIQGLPADAVANILLYHVMPGRHTSTSVLARDNFRMLNGQRLSISEIVPNKLDQSASNGVIHIINSVLIP